MSINPTLPQLAETLARYRFAYLVTIGDDARTHVVPVHPVFAGTSCQYAAWDERHKRTSPLSA